MAHISIRHAHALGADEVREKTADLIDDVKREFPSLVKDISWNGGKTCATVKGRAFSGTFALVGNSLNIEIKLSLMARPFKGMVEKKIHDRLREHFP
jgi:putative polyhydroxyalkanoate system protein